MCRVAIDIPSEVLYDTRMSEEDALDFVRKAAAVHYYVKNGVSLGYCAQIANMDKEQFIRYLGDNGISVFHFDNEDEFLEELANA